MQFNLKFMREFFKFFHQVENDPVNDVNDFSKFNSLEVGVVSVKTPTGKKNFPLHITQEKRQAHNTAWIVRLVNGRLIILFYLDCFMQCIDTPNMNGLYATVAHEVGHYLAGHFDRTPNKNLDIKTEEQEFFIKQYQANPTLQNEMRYMRCLFFALLRGAVNIAEIEADMIALKLVPLADLVHIHTQDFNNHSNPFTIVEKVNRIKWLNRYYEMKRIDSTGYELHIELHDMTKSKEEREKREEPDVLLA